MSLFLRILQLIAYLLAMGVVATLSFALYRHYANFVAEVVGDPKLAGAVIKRRYKWGIRKLAIASIDLSDKQKPVRYAFVNAELQTKFELGTASQALTGLLVADSVRRRELVMNKPLGQQCPRLTGPLAEHRLQELVTHRAGLPRLPRSMWWRRTMFQLFGLNPFPTTGPDVVALGSRTQLKGPDYRASILGAAVAGQLVADRSGVGFREVMQTRLLDPIGMPDTSFAPEAHKIPRGWTAISRRAFPWRMDGYAPGAGAVTNIIDMATLARTMLGKQAIGLGAMTPLAARKADRERIGTFWHVEQVSGQEFAYVSGKSGGYSAFIGILPRKKKAVVILSNVATPHANTRLGAALAGWLCGDPDPEPTGFGAIRKPSDLLTLYGYKRR